MWLSAALALAMFIPDYTADGMKALEEQRYEAAIASFTKAAEADPKDYSAYFHIALAQSLLNRDPEAIASYRKVLELKPGLYEAQLNLGIVLLRSKQAEQAAQSLEEAAKQKPKEFRPAYYAGQALLESGTPDRAIPYFRTALELDANSIPAQAGLGQSLARTGKLDEAAPYLEKAGSLLELGPLYEKANRRADAIEVYRKFPDDPGARERLGELLLEGGDTAKAIPELEASVAKSPTAANRYALATAYIQNNEYAKAEPLIQAALEQEPGDLALRMNYARVLRQQKKYAPAADQFSQIVKAKPDDARPDASAQGLAQVESWPRGAGVRRVLHPRLPADADRRRRGAQRGDRRGQWPGIDGG